MAKVNMRSTAEQLHYAFLKSTLTPFEFYTHIVSTRAVEKKCDTSMSFKILDPETEDLEWFGWSLSEKKWIEL